MFELRREWITGRSLQLWFRWGHFLFLENKGNLFSGLILYNEHGASHTDEIFFSANIQHMSVHLFLAFGKYALL